MKKYEFLEHTADAKFRAYGKTLEERFTNAALAMTKVMTNPSKINAKIKKSIDVIGADLKNLLYNFLEQFLVLLDSENFILNNVKSIKIIQEGKKYHLTATIVGDTVNGKYEIETGIKAVTYMDMEIKGNYVQVVVDI